MESPAAKRCRSTSPKGPWSPRGPDRICFIKLIAEALMASPDKRLTLRDIYVYAANKFPSLLSSNTSWKNSIRFRLSTNDCFIKGKSCGNRGSYWYINDEYIQEIKKGEYKVNYNRKRFYGKSKRKEKNSSESTDDCSSGNENHATDTKKNKIVNDSFVFQQDKASVKTVKDTTGVAKPAIRTQEPEFPKEYIRDASLDEFSSRVALKMGQLSSCSAYTDPWSFGQHFQQIPNIQDSVRSVNDMCSYQNYANESYAVNSCYPIDIKPDNCVDEVSPEVYGAQSTMATPTHYKCEEPNPINNSYYCDSSTQNYFNSPNVQSSSSCYSNYKHNALESLKVHDYSASSLIPDIQPSQKLWRPFGINQISEDPQDRQPNCYDVTNYHGFEQATLVNFESNKCYSEPSAYPALSSLF